MIQNSLPRNNSAGLFLGVLGTIILIGLVMVFSSSYMYAKEVYESSLYLLTRQLFFVLIGVVVTFIVSKTKFSFWIKYGPYINFISLTLLFLTLFPALGSSVKGARRWISLGGLTFQPGEIVKYTLIFSSITFFDDFFHHSTKRKFIHGLSLLSPLILLVLQPDFGTFFICFILLSVVCFLSNFPRKYFFAFSLSGIVIGTAVLFMKSYRVERILAFLDPWKNAKTTGFQIIQSYLALASGKIMGKGLGNSSEKLFYLPEAHNDFILSVIGEELGFIGIFIVVLLFIAVLYLGIRIALNFQNRTKRIVVSSIIIVITLQAVLNMGVVLGLLPTKGLNLPFISYGGSSMVANMFAIGIILSAIREEKRVSC